MSNSTTALNNIHSKLNKIFQNPNINFFIIMNLILMISCYTFINTPLKYSISSFLANPIIILFSLILIVLIGYYNINIAILILLLLFIALFGSTLFNTKNTTMKSTNGIEGFTDNTDNDNDNDEDENENNDDSDDEQDLENPARKKNGNIYGNDGDEEINSREKTKQEFLKKTKEDKVNSRKDKINSIKDVILGGVNKMKSGAENEHKKALLENKQMIYENEKKNNKMNSSKKNSNSGSNSKSSKHSGKEEFQTIEIRAFDPSSEEDTNLIITKEILQDMLNRIKYNFESNKYLKKYLKHRIEEIVDINKLVDEDED